MKDMLIETSQTEKQREKRIKNIEQTITRTMRQLENV